MGIVRPLPKFPVPRVAPASSRIFSRMSEDLSTAYIKISTNLSSLSSELSDDSSAACRVVSLGLTHWILGRSLLRTVLAGKAPLELY